MPQAQAAPGKLDAFLQQAVAERRQGLLRVMVTLAGREEAESCVRSALTARNRAAGQALMDGRILVTTVDVDDLVELVASQDVDRISLDAVVRAGGAGN